MSLLLTPKEAAAELRIGRTRLYELFKAHEIVSIMVGGSRRVSREALVAYVKRLEAEQSGDAGEAA